MTLIEIMLLWLRGVWGECNICTLFVWREENICNDFWTDFITLIQMLRLAG